MTWASVGGAQKYTKHMQKNNHDQGMPGPVMQVAEQTPEKNIVMDMLNRTVSRQCGGLIDEIEQNPGNKLQDYHQSRSPTQPPSQAKT